MHPIIILIGLPGSGKSTVGRQLARKWQLPFIDSDHAIEEVLGGSIRSYFESHGEQAFRDVETQVLRSLLDRQEALVLSTGGGAVLREENRKMLNTQGTVFYLQAAPEDIARRLRHDTTRPLMQGADPLIRLQELQAQRAPLYLQTAHYVIDTGRLSTTQTVRKLVMQAELSGMLL